MNAANVSQGDDNHLSK